MKLIFWPIFLLRTLYRLPWVITLGLAGALGYVAYTEYENYQFEVFEAEYQAGQPPPDPVPLSQLSRRDAAITTSEIAVEGLYFTGLPETTIDPLGVEKGVILLADEQGREIKAVLVVSPSELSDLRRELAAQGSGDRFRVSVNGFYNANSEWAQLVDSRLAQLGLPSAGDVVVVEPFIGGREAGLLDRAEDALALPAVLGGLAALLGGMGVLRWLTTSSGTAQTPRRRTRKPATKAPAQTAQPAMAQTPAASPWSPNQSAKPQPSPKQAQPTARKTPDPTPDPDVTPAEPEFKSVFPGGGSGFRFKTADEIIRETFGTVSLINRPPPSSKG